MAQKLWEKSVRVNDEIDRFTVPPTRNRIKLSLKELKDYNQVGFKLLLPIFSIHIDAIIITCYFYFSIFFKFFIVLMLSLIHIFWGSL